jgi:hypothetical protein
MPTRRSAGSGSLSGVAKSSAPGEGSYGLVGRQDAPPVQCSISGPPLRPFCQPTARTSHAEPANTPLSSLVTVPPGGCPFAQAWRVRAFAIVDPVRVSVPASRADAAISQGRRLSRHLHAHHESPNESAERMLATRPDTPLEREVAAATGRRSARTPAAALRPMTHETLSLTIVQ